MAKQNLGRVTGFVMVIYAMFAPGVWAACPENPADCLSAGDAEAVGEALTGGANPFASSNPFAPAERACSAP